MSGDGIFEEKSGIMIVQFALHAYFVVLLMVDNFHHPPPPSLFSTTIIFLEVSKLLFDEHFILHIVTNETKIRILAVIMEETVMSKYR